MAQGHLDRLTSVDAGFLHIEDGGDAHMHIGALAVLEGPAPTGAQFREFLHSRLHRIPRFRQKVQEMPLGTGRPLWVEDEAFSLSYHVRHTALPAPGGEEQLLTLASRIVSQRLDRTKPLWEMWLVEGLSDGRWAIINKTHHAMVDGVSGVDIISVLFDLSADAPADEAPPAWQPRGTPGAVDLLAAGAFGAVRDLTGLTVRSMKLGLSPRRAVTETLGAVQAVGEMLRPLVGGAPHTPLNRKPGPHRRVELVRTRLADYKTVKDGLGGTVNDVVLAAVAGGLGRFLDRRAFPVAGLTLRACVPVSVRTADGKGALGNQIAIMVAPLAVGIEDPAERLAVVRAAMQDVKSSKQAEGARVLTQMESFLPPTVLAQAARLSFSSRLYNLLVTNVPGPQFAVYMQGRRLLELFPLAFLAVDHTLAVAILSYDGAVNIGLLGDADALPDLPDLAEDIRVALADLVDAAKATAGA